MVNRLGLMVRINDLVGFPKGLTSGLSNHMMGIPISRDLYGLARYGNFTRANP